MISRRTVIAGLSAMVAPAASGGAGQRRPHPVSARNSATPRPGPVPPGVGLDAVIDINHTNDVTDFRAIRACGILGVVHKATEGGDWCDPLYARRRAEARVAGLLWGAYHFGTREHSGARQAAACLAAVQPDPATLIALDLEPNEDEPANTMTIGQAEDFVRAVHQATGRLPLLYVHAAWADGDAYGRRRVTLGGPIAPGSILASCDLWLANFRNEEPRLPAAWTGRGWRFWQYAADDYPGTLYGSRSRAVSGVDGCDRDVFLGDADTLSEYWSGTAERLGR